jgi:hypothetical protein
MSYQAALQKIEQAGEEQWVVLDLLRMCRSLDSCHYCGQILAITFSRIKFSSSMASGD